MPISQFIYSLSHKNICLYSFIVLSVTHQSFSWGEPLSWCQNPQRLLVIDIEAINGIGFMHQLDDFFYASKLAIFLDRTLVDFIPVFRRTHSIDFDGKVPFGNASTLTWPFRYFLNRDRLVFTVKSTKPKVCILGTKDNPPTEDETKKFGYDILTLTLEHNQLPKTSRLWQFDVKKSVSLGRLNGSPEEVLRYVQWTPGGKPFSSFFKVAAKKVRYECLEKHGNLMKLRGANDEVNRRFFLVHLRGTDRPCMKQRMTPMEVVNRIEAFLQRKPQDLIYLMTNIEKEDSILKTVTSHFGDALFQASDIRLFHKEPFKSNGYFRYVTELAIQKISDGFATTYRTYMEKRTPLVDGRELGYIVNLTDRYMKTC